MSIGGHQSPKSLKEEWLTPPWLIEALGKFDLDPCAPIIRPWDTAKKHFTIADNGLNKEWFGRVWLNPPYGRKTDFWLARMADHNRGTALMFARTETNMFFEHIWNSASALLFLKGRISFHHANGTLANHSGGAPSVLIAYGEEDFHALKSCGLEGKFISL